MIKSTKSVVELRWHRHYGVSILSHRHMNSSTALAAGTVIGGCGCGDVVDVAVVAVAGIVVERHGE